MNETNRRRYERVPPLAVERPISPSDAAIEADRKRRKSPYSGARDAIWQANQPSKAVR